DTHLDPYSCPYGVAVDGSGNVFFSDACQRTVRKVAADGSVSIYAGTPGTSGYSGDGGPASGARLDSPYGLAMDSDGNLFISDTGNNRVRRVGGDPSLPDQYQIIRAYAGNGMRGYSVDDIPATSAELYYPRG